MSIGIGQVVYAADPSAMLALCDTYHSRVTHGIVADIDLDYAASVCVLWFVGDEPQTVAYWVEPDMLSTTDGYSNRGGDGDDTVQ